MPFHPAEPASVAAFVSILVFVLASLLWAVHRAYASARKTALAAVLVASALLAQSAIVGSGRMVSLPFQGMPFFFGTIAIGAAGLGISRVGKRLATTLSIGALVAFQAFRLPLEIVLHAWFRQGTIPEAMTWSGQNFDIVSGVVAAVCAPFAARELRVAWFANVVGIALLLNVMRVAAMSSPVPFGWHLDPPLQLAAHLPYSFIGPVCVGGAIFGHVVLTRSLWARRKARGSA